MIENRCSMAPLFHPLEASPRMSILCFVSCLFLLLAPGCRGKSKNDAPPSPPTNIGGGYTLVVSGGTLNDGTTLKGLSILATLRDSQGNGPGGAAGWTITITGPGINPALVVDYDDGSASSYSTWWWEKFNPQSGTYTAYATNGSTTLSYSFAIDAAKTMAKPVLNKSGDTISWNPVTNAGSYSYKVTDGAGSLPLKSGYIAYDPVLTSYSFQLPALSDGSYLVSVYALTQDRLALGSDDLSQPVLPSQENASLVAMDFAVGGTGTGYSLQAVGGVLYEGLYSEGTGTPSDQYGLVVWTSILTTSSSPTPPAGDWNLSITGPGITTSIVTTYPKTDSHYLYWDFETIPAGGTYTVTATPAAGGTSLTQTFTIPSPTSKLPVVTGLTVTPTSGGGANINWNFVTGAGSYYVNAWTYIWNAGLNRWVYTEIAGNWVSSNAAAIQAGTLTPGLEYDIYVTASQLNMTDTKSVPLPVAPGSQVNMSDNTFNGYTFTAI